MDDKQLNFNQPLLSVRRTNPPPSIPPLPYYKPDLKSGPVSNPGVVPFQWEQIPGKPKNSRKQKTNTVELQLPPGRVVSTDGGEFEFAPLEDGNDENDSSYSEGESSTYLDALDTLSRTESFMNCSLSGVSGLDGPCVKSSGTFSDLQTRDFMMGRFLPAAKAVASETPHFGSRKQSKDEKKVVILDKQISQYCYTPKSLLQHCKDEEYEEEDDDIDSNDDYTGNETVSSKLCGLLPRFCLLNPISGMKYQTQSSLPSSVHKSHKKCSDSGIYEYNKSEKAIRDAVYEKRRLTVYQRSNTRVEADLKDELKKHNEKNASLKWNDLSQISNSEKNNIVSFRNVSRNSLMETEKGFLGIPEATDAIEKTLYVDSPAQSKECRDSNSRTVLPPPLPKSPSESWLSRALPTISVKHRHSYLGESKWVSAVKCSSLHNNNNNALMPISEK